MRLSRLAITLILLISALAIHADEAAEIRERIPRLQGERLLSAYDRLYRLSLEGDDLSYQLRCISICQQTPGVPLWFWPTSMSMLVVPNRVMT